MTRTFTMDRCAACRREGTLQPWEGKLTLYGVEIDARGPRCSVCGETYFDWDEVGRQERAVADALVDRGIVSGKEFKFVRKIAKLKSVELAELFGIRPETISRWEAGEYEIPRTAAFALGELYRHPKLTRQRLEAFAAAGAAHASASAKLE